jgi:hypothetical protein
MGTASVFCDEHTFETEHVAYEVDPNSQFNYPAYTVETSSNIPVNVRWIYDLVDDNGNFLPHLLPIDQTLHWANPPATGCRDGSNRTDCGTNDPTFYTGPVPIVTHVHGSHVDPHSDGYPEAWWLPAANNIPAGYATSGSIFDDATGTNPGNTVLQLNVPGDPVRSAIREIPIVVQDRSFNADGSLFYPDNRAFFEGLNVPPTPPFLDIPFVPDSDIAPIWNPEAFFNVMVVNGVSWPTLEVAPTRSRACSWPGRTRRRHRRLQQSAGRYRRHHDQHRARRTLRRLPGHTG